MEKIMAKSKQKANKPLQKSENKISFKLSSRYQDIIFISIIAIILLIILKPLVIDRLSAQGVDVIGSIGKTHQISEYKKETGESALWNPTIFAGMPIYHRITPVAYSLDNLFSWMGRYIHTIFIYYLFAGIGFYWMLRYLKMPPLISVIGALIFIMMPHYKSLYLEGHIAKLRAITFLPWVFLSFRYFLDRRSTAAAALFALAFGLQIRTQHYQVVFYTALLVFAIGVYPFIKTLIEKKYSLFIKSLALLILAIVLSITMSAQPLFLAKEYLPYSKRGKTTIEVNAEPGKQQGAAVSDGVQLEYATRWSTHPAELLTWVIPRFYGGMSAEVYTGDAIPQAKGQVLSLYWGHMPFTQSYEYMGVIALLLAILGIFAYRKEKLVISISLFALFLILLSFGRHFESFYGLFYHYVPFFNKFRAPMMSVTVTYFIVALLVAFGLRYIMSLSDKQDDWQSIKTTLYIAGGFFVLGVAIGLSSMGFTFIKEIGERYQGQNLELISRIRKELFNADLIRYFILLILSVVSIFLFLKKKMNFVFLGIIIAAIIMIDLISIQTRSNKKFVNRDRLEKQYFKKTATDQFLLQDKDIFRIFPTGQMFGDNRWAYFHKNIGGYTPIKMYVIEELVEKNIYNGQDADIPINWNVLKILNVKYVILQQQVSNENLELVNIDEANKIYTYLFKNYLPHGFFVNNYQVVPDEFERIRLINTPEFDPGTTAILEEQPPVSVTSPDSISSELVEYTPNLVKFDIYTDKEALFVISDIYYPPGWKLYIDEQGKEGIYKTNHAVQSIVVPEGKHTVELRFTPESFSRNIRLASISLGILYLTIIGSVISALLKRGKNN